MPVKFLLCLRGGDREEPCAKAGLYDQIWQAFALLLPVKTVGVMGDGRTYEYVVGLRAVTSTDGMTADFHSFDMKFLGETATRIINEVKGVNRVVYDVTSKPPGTIEWEWGHCGKTAIPLSKVSLNRSNPWLPPFTSLRALRRSLLAKARRMAASAFFRN